LSAPLPPQIFVWQATGHGGRIGEEMQPAWAWLPKSSGRCFRRGAPLVNHLLMHGRRFTGKRTHGCSRLMFTAFKCGGA